MRTKKKVKPDIQEKVVEVLSQLVAHPVLGGQSNIPLLEYMKAYLTDLGVTYQLVPNETGDKACLICRIGPAVDGGIVLSGHMDVVPVAGQDWHSDPFQLTEKEGRLYGRGSCDMKGFLACCLALVPEMIEADLQKPIYLAFSYDEEIGCLLGYDIARAIRDTFPEQPMGAIIGEPSLMHPVVGHKGICVYETIIKGSAGHSSRIRQEVSAIHEAARLIQWLEDKMESLVGQGHLDDRFYPPHTSLHVGVLRGGIAPNVIADQCMFRWDIRVIPRDDLKQIIAEFDAFCREREKELRKRFPGAEISNREFHPPVPPLDAPENHPIVKLAQSLSGISELKTVAFATEAGQFAEVGFPSVVCGPGSIDQAHRADEYISIEQLEKGAAFLQKLIHSLSISD